MHGSKRSLSHSNRRVALDSMMIPSPTSKNTRKGSDESSCSFACAATDHKSTPGTNLRKIASEERISTKFHTTFAIDSNSGGGGGGACSPNTPSHTHNPVSDSPCRESCSIELGNLSPRGGVSFGGANCTNLKRSGSFSSTRIQHSDIQC